MKEGKKWGPDYGEAFQLDGGIALLGRGQSFRPTVHNLEVLRTCRIDVDVPECVPKTV